MRSSPFVAAIGLLFAPDAKAQSTAPPAPTSLAPSSLAPAAPVSPGPAGPRVLTDGRAAPAQAAEHFERALAWYRAGKYRRASEELKAALERDPGGKDLMFNLALVQEKLGDLAGAIDSLQRFQTLEKDPKELERATQTIGRLRGAREELVAAPVQSPTIVSNTLTTDCAPERVRGKLDGWVIGTGGFALASLLVGTVFGVRALALDGESEGSRARDSAIVADVALATGLLVGAGSVTLYWGRFVEAPTQSALMPPSGALPGAALAHVRVQF